MASIINTSEFMLLHNAKNATTVTTSQLPSPTQSDGSDDSSHESFDLVLSRHRLNYYIESVVLSKSYGDEKTEAISVTKSKALLEQLNPGQDVASLFHLQLASCFRKHSDPVSALEALSRINTGLNNKELPDLKEKGDRVAYWYYKALSSLEQNRTENVEEMAKNGIIEAISVSEEAARKVWVEVGYFVMVVYHTLKGDELEARFWKERIPAGWQAPPGLWSKHEDMVRSAPNTRYTAATIESKGQQVSLPHAVSERGRDIDGLEGMTAQDVLLRDVAQLKREMNEVHDTVHVNYRELCERIRAIHGILDQKDKIEGRDLEELKRRMNYLEGMTLRG
ncbi:hypothetical protein TWF694_005783 [Orbilia ellipsospora]|uniref:Uncharacterized protein n=1 Tax=Orbilia ellipsospora TaxID=2528407 RepID=A0AAV9WRY7_9PEZI